MHRVGARLGEEQAGRGHVPLGARSHQRSDVLERSERDVCRVREKELKHLDRAVSGRLEQRAVAVIVSGVGRRAIFEQYRGALDVPSRRSRVQRARAVTLVL